MAGNRAAAPRSGAPLGSQRDQLVVLGSIVVLAVATVVVLVGLYLTVYRPPRAHVLTAGAEDYTADEVYRRGLYMMLFEPAVGPRNPSEIVTKTLDTIEREETLRTRAKALVPEVTPDDIAAELQRQFAPAIPSVPNPEVRNAAGEVIGTAVPSNSPTPVPTLAPDEFTKSLQQRLETAQITKSQLDAIVAADLYRKRLTDKFKAELPTSLPQTLLVTARIADQPTADRVRSIGLRPNVDFAQVASQNSVSDAQGARAGVPTWVVVDQLDPKTRDVVKQMNPGDISPVTQVGTAYEVYKVVEVSASRELTDEQKTEMAGKKVTEWLDAEVKQLSIERDLTPEKEQWITEHVVEAYTKASPPTSAR